MNQFYYNETERMKKQKAILHDDIITANRVLQSICFALVICLIIFFAALFSY